MKALICLQQSFVENPKPYWMGQGIDPKVSGFGFGVSGRGVYLACPTFLSFFVVCYNPLPNQFVTDPKTNYIAALGYVQGSGVLLWG